MRLIDFFKPKQNVILNWGELGLTPRPAAPVRAQGRRLLCCWEVRGLWWLSNKKGSTWGGYRPNGWEEGAALLNRLVTVASVLSPQSVLLTGGIFTWA